MIKKLAFTLGEVLIALAVIGVVATIVMPQIAAGQKAAKGLAQFNTAHSLIAKAIADMDSDEISVEPKDYPTRTFYEKFIKYNKLVIDCGGANASANTSVCPSTSTYKDITGSTNIDTNILDDGAFVLNNGMLFAVENCKGCSWGDDHNIWIVADINGKNYLPNKLGYDLFAFQLTDGGDILPVGAPGTDARFSAVPENYCCLKSRNINKSCTIAEPKLNGVTCAYYASTNEDYFKNLYRGY